MAGTERNFILKKDEARVEVERLKKERDISDDARDLIGKLVDKIPGGRRPAVPAKKSPTA